MKILLLSLLILTPGLTFAQTGSVQGLIVGIGGFINSVVIPFILGLAFLIFLINVVRFFIIGGHNTEGQENARSLALYGIGAFVLILSLWGIVNILTEGIGFEGGPCINGDMIQSDYIKLSTLCSSPRPAPRPVSQPNSTPPGENFGQGIPGSVPPGGVVGSPNPEGPGVNLPGNDIPPTIPDSPTSFTPDGQPITYTSVANTQTPIRSAATSYFNGEANLDFGNNKALVAPLLADFTQSQNAPLLEIDRLKAAVRLEKLGIISQTEVTEYLDAYNSYAQKAGTANAGPITLANLNQTLAVTKPAALAVNSGQTKQTLIDTLTLYNQNSNNTQVNISSIVNSIYQSNATTEARYDAVLALYYPQSGRPVLSITNPASKALLNRFIADINTEKMYNGEFDLIK